MHDTHHRTMVTAGLLRDADERDTEQAAFIT